MKSVFIDSAFLNFVNSSANGLITGLKILSKNNFQLFSVKSKIKNFGLIESILTSEEIKLNEYSETEVDIDYCISTQKTKDKSRKQIVVSSKSKIKRIAEAIDEILREENTIVHSRITKETAINIKLNLRGSGASKIKSGIGFFDHMLDQIARHSNCDLEITVKGDLEVDEHHTVEDTGIALGEALDKALGDRRGIMRFGFFTPMDDSLGSCFLDLGGRSFLKFNASFKREKVGEFPTELVKEFFKGLSMGLRANLHMKTSGDNEHHKIESLFKAFAKALNEAFKKDERNQNTLPSTKGKI
ncbi:MAG: imidazoleglycerol-phosphate dehydratase HisB [bacterium]